MAHPDMDDLLNEAFHAAEEFLEKIGEFFPFVVTMAPSGEISHAQEHLGEKAPGADETIDVLVEGLKNAAAKGKYKATAVVSHAQIASPDGKYEEAISATLEHRSEPPVICYLPFKQTKGKIDYGEIFAKRGDADCSPKARMKRQKRPSIRMGTSRSRMANDSRNHNKLRGELTNNNERAIVIPVVWHLIQRRPIRRSEDQPR